MVEAAGIEPDHPQPTNRLMAHDFRRTTTILRRFSPSIESPGVPSCPLESTPVVEIFWRRRWRTEASNRRQRSGWAAVSEKRNSGRRINPWNCHVLNHARREPFLQAWCAAGLPTYRRASGRNPVGVDDSERFAPRDDSGDHPVSLYQGPRAATVGLAKPRKIIRTGEGWLHLAMLLDLFSRKIVGWATSANPRQELALEALRMAIGQHQPRPGLIHHSDRGGQYSSAEYQNLLDQHGMRCSMSRPGNCLDNAVAESFFHTLKTEWI